MAMAGLVLLVLATAGRAGAVGRDGFSLFASVGSDYVFRGVSQTIEDPAFQIGLTFDHASGWYGGLWASTVDFPTNALRDRPREVEVDLWVGYGFEMASGWGLALEARQYEYPDDSASHDYDYTEWAAILQRGRSALAVSYSEEALGQPSPGLALEVSHRRDLPRRIDLVGGLGLYDLEGPFLGDYLFWNLTAGRTIGRFRFELGYFDTDDRGDRVWGDLAGERLVATVSVRFL